MFLDVKQLFDGGTIRADFSGELKIPDDMSEISSATVVGAGEVHADVVTLKAVITANVKTKCVRCLEDVSREFSIDVFHTLVKKLNLVDKLSDEYIEVTEDKIDLTELMLSEVIFALPTKIMCSVDCKGLCPSCGINLNTDSCSCDTRYIDPRLEALKKLLD